MKYLKMLGLAAVAAAAVMAFVGAGTASAESTLCKVTVDPCPEASRYGAGTVIKAQLEAGTHATLHAGFAEITCKKSTVEGKIETATTPSGKITSLTFTECGTAVVKVLKTGTLTAHHTSAHNGNLTVSGVEVTIEQNGVHCIYGGNITTGLALTASSSSTTPATMNSTAKIPLLSGGFFCANPANWTAKYEVTTPIPLYVTTGV
jgi:hypothetical protein